MFKARQPKSRVSRFVNWVWPSIGVSRAWRYLMFRLARMKASPHKLALGFAAGAFVSFTPFMGFHFLLAAATALAVRGNVLASAIGTVVGNPLTFPFIWLASYNLGAALLGEPPKVLVDIGLHDPSLSLFQDPVIFLIALWGTIKPLVLPMLTGGIPLGLLVGAICYLGVRTAIVELQSYKAQRKSKFGRL